MSHTSIHQHYSEDHDRLDGLFRQFRELKAADGARARVLFGEFKSGLERHIVWEEEILFPAFENKTGITQGPTQVMRIEHREIKGFLQAIAGKLDAGDFATDREEVGLLAVLGPHNEKEEGILYPMIDRVTDARDLDHIYDEMNKRP